MKSYVFSATASPPDALAGIDTTHIENGWTVKIADGVLTLSVTSDQPEGQLWREAEEMLRVVLADLAWSWRKLSATVTACESRVPGGIGLGLRDTLPEIQDSVSTTVRVAGANAVAAAHDPTVLVDGKVVTSPYPVWSRNAVALQARDYYLQAEANSDQALFYLYKAMEHLKPKVGGWKGLAKSLNLTSGYIDYVKTRADISEYDERHALGPGEVRKKLSPHEIEECRQRVRRILELYAAANPV